MKYLVLSLCLIGCAGQEAPERVADALDATKGVYSSVESVYTTVEDLRARLNEISVTLCQPAIIPELKDPCDKIAEGLKYAQDGSVAADEGLDVAHDAINAAIEAYNEVNNELP